MPILIRAPVTGREPEINPAEPMYALAEFYRALNSRDLDLMAQNWDESGEIVMNNPVGGILRGWLDIRAIYERIFASLARVHVELHDYTLQRHGEIFLAVGRERGYLVREAMRFDLAIRTSRIYRWRDERWRQIHHHGSFDDPVSLARYQLAVL